MFFDSSDWPKAAWKVAAVVMKLIGNLFLNHNIILVSQYLTVYYPSNLLVIYKFLKEFQCCKKISRIIFCCL
jgi:hypothetical protein